MSSFIEQLMESEIAVESEIADSLSPPPFDLFRVESSSPPSLRRLQGCSTLPFCLSCYDTPAFQPHQAPLYAPSTAPSRARALLSTFTILVFSPHDSSLNSIDVVAVGLSVKPIGIVCYCHSLHLLAV
uniref:Ovule protein n=1 Tax=Steinernema glaseri TaxID=37863 RepID=A0A1I7Z5Z2_9BILA